MKQINWGIIGLGAIAFKFAKGFKFLDKAKLLAIGSKNSTKLKKFQKEFNIDNVFNLLGGYTAYLDLTSNQL